MGVAGAYCGIGCLGGCEGPGKEVKGKRVPQLLSLLSLALVAVFDQLTSEKRKNFLESSSVDLALNPVPLLTSCLTGEIRFII